MKIIEDGKEYSVSYWDSDRSEPGSCGEQWYLQRGRDFIIHRELGPAIESTDGTIKRWFLFGKEYSEEEFKRYLKLKAFI
jgi:hypothetical protein